MNWTQISYRNQKPVIIFTTSLKVKNHVSTAVGWCQTWIIAAAVSEISSSTVNLFWVVHQQHWSHQVLSMVKKSAAEISQVPPQKWLIVSWIYFPSGPQRWLLSSAALISPWFPMAPNFWPCHYQLPAFTIMPCLLLSFPSAPARCLCNKIWCTIFSTAVPGRNQFALISSRLFLLFSLHPVFYPCFLCV